MYTAFYGLREKPFALSPDPRFLFLAESHREALAHLLYGIDQGEGFIAVTGEVGTGKTTICRTLLDRLGSETTVAFLFNPSSSAAELLRAIASEFGLDNTDRQRGELGDQLNRFLLEEMREGRRALLIIDEAQNLSADTLEQVRLLSNLETSSAKLIQILLLGQPELDRKLDSPSLRQLRQRVSVRWALMPMSPSETREYVRHRLRVAAGAPREIFTPRALAEIYRRSRGIPRLVNVLCDRTLLAGYAEQAHQIGPRLVQSCAREIPDVARRRPRPSSDPARRGWWGGAAAALATGLLLAGALAGLRFEDPAGWLGRYAGIATDPFGEVSAPPPSGPSPAPPASLPTVVPMQAAPVVPSPAPEVTLIGAILETQDLVALESRAVREILASYGLDDEIPPMADSGLRGMERLRARGLAILPLQGATLDTLRSLNHPALLQLRSDSGAPRLVTLTGLDADRVTLFSTVDGPALRFPAEEVEKQWDGRAFVVWRNFEPVPDIIVPGVDRSAILWLQVALSELGLYRGQLSGEFDGTTLDGVRSLQLARQLRPDGAVGPRTKMVLYDMLGTYAVPRLAGPGGPG